MSSSFDEKKSREFFSAAGNGNLPVLESLSQDPEVNLNFQDLSGWTPFYVACCDGHVDAVRFLLDFHGNHQRGPIDYNLANYRGWTPFWITCLKENQKVLEVLLEDDRIDVNRATPAEVTPLWETSYHGHVGIVKMLLASAKELDVLKRDKTAKMTAAEIARERGVDVQKYSWESDRQYQQRREGCPLIASMLQSYQSDRQGVRAQLRRELGLDVRLAGELFALVVYLTDGYLSIRSENQAHREERFLSIAAQLPMDLQMVLCNRVFGVGNSIVKQVHSERGFRKFAKRS